MTTRTDPSVQAFQHNAREQAVVHGLALVAAAGSTQGGATAIPDTAERVYVTVTASSQGIKLPTAATGKNVTVFAMSGKGVKVYPYSGDRIQGAATNVAVALVLNKSTMFQAVDTNNWRQFKGA